jgi:glucan phosphorylase
MPPSGYGPWRQRHLTLFAVGSAISRDSTRKHRSRKAGDRPKKPSLDIPRAPPNPGGLAVRDDAWARKAILNVACSGNFSSDRTIAEHSAHIRNAEPCPLL